MNKTLVITVFFSCIGNFLFAQNIQLSNVKVGKLQNFDYFGTDAKFHYFSSTGNMIHLFDKQNLSAFKAIEYKFDNKKEFTWSSHMIENKLIIISKLSETGKTSSTSMINVYRFDPATGATMKVVKTGGTVEKSIYYTSTIDTSRKQIVITVSDSIVTLLDFDLQPVSFDKDVKYKRNSGFFGDIEFDVEKFLASLNIKGLSFSTTSTGPKSHTDSSSVKNFIVSYERTENKAIEYFEKSIDKVNIHTRKKDSKVKDIDFSVSSDKTIIDLYFREEKNGNLIVIGKYLTGSDNFAHYGMFSAKYDQSLNEMSPLKYYDLVSANTGEKSVPNKRYIGLFYTKLAFPQHTFNQEDETTIFIYQKSFNNVKDHIYILKVESNGELTVNMIANQVIVDKKYPYRTETYIPVLLRDKLVFIFYENPVNLDLSANEVNVAWCDVNKSSTVLVSCNYDISSDDVRKKQLIGEVGSFSTLPHLNEYNLYYDEESGQCVCLIPGETPKNVTKTLYQLSLSY